MWSDRFSRRWALVVAFMVCLGGTALAQPEGDDFAWVEDIVLRRQVTLDANESRTTRWLVAPKVTVFGGTKEQQNLVGEVVRDLNKTLKQTVLKKIDLLRPNQAGATLPVYLVPKSAIPMKAAKLGIPGKVVQHIADEKWSHVAWNWQYPGKNWQVQRGLVIIASDEANAGWLKHNLLASLCASLGLMNTSTRQPDSVFYRDGEKSSNTETLTPKDQQLLIWYYNHVPPGTNAINKLYKDTWSKAVPKH